MKTGENPKLTTVLTWKRHNKDEKTEGTWRINWMTIKQAFQLEDPQVSLPWMTGIKITNEPPKGLRANLSRTFQDTPPGGCLIGLNVNHVRCHWWCTYLLSPLLFFVFFRLHFSFTSFHRVFLEHIFSEKSVCAGRWEIGGSDEIQLFQVIEVPKQRIKQTDEQRQNGTLCWYLYNQSCHFVDFRWNSEKMWHLPRAPNNSYKRRFFWRFPQKCTVTSWLWLFFHPGWIAGYHSWDLWRLQQIQRI